MENLDNLMKVDYDELHRNVFNKDWSGWSNVYAVITQIEQKGSKSRRHPDSKILHVLEFLNAHLLEERVREVLHLDYLAEDHAYLYAKRGDNVPDFVNSFGLTYELKSRWNFSDARFVNWYDADVCLFYCKSDNTLYRYEPKTNEFLRLKYIRSEYVDTKIYPYSDEDLFKI